MGTFSYVQGKKFSMGNRVAYKYTLTNVQTDSTSIIHTPFKKITGYFPSTTSVGTSFINIAANTPTTGGTGKCATLTLDAGAESNGEIIVVGLL